MRLSPVNVHREDGFTLVELIVGMVLGMIVLTMIIAFVIKSMGAGDRSGLRVTALRASMQASGQLTSDLRALRAPERQPKFIGNPDSARSLLLRGENPGGIIVEDIVEATSTRLVFYAELMNSSASTECVTWQVMPDGALHRTVRGFTRDCTGGAVLQDREVMPRPERARASDAAAVPDPFAYLMFVQPQPNDPNIDPSKCTNERRFAATTALQRNQIQGVALDLRSFVANGSGHGDSRLIHAVSLSSRQGIDYRYAIGCAA